VDYARQPFIEIASAVGLVRSAQGRFFVCIPKPRKHQKPQKRVEWGLRSNLCAKHLVSWGLSILIAPFGVGGSLK
jgi:hypothetical protein